jgi:cellulose synthase/poly-beta-1,6-N-acetylglucosamine synthase-like glycosyltransferase
MVSLSIGLFVVLMVFAIIQLIYVVGFARALQQRKWPALADEACPKVAVMLPLRGADPFLADCIDGLLNQDYPRMSLHVIVDSELDPAWSVIHQILAKYPDNQIAHVESLKTRLDTCGLRNSSLLQCDASLDDTYEVLAIVDADVLAHPTWLRELVAPLSDDQYAASSGNRWYMPEKATWGSLVRYVWNAGAVVQMYWNNYVWGGSVAVRRSFITETEKNEGWRRAIVSLDTSIHLEMRRQGKRVAFVPTLLMTNREDCDLPGFYPWVKRQLLLSRLYSPKWLMVIGHGLLTSVLLIFAMCLAFVMVVQGYGGQALGVIASLLVYVGIMIGCLVVLEVAVRKVVEARGETTRWLSIATILKLGAALPLTQLVYTGALMGAATMRRVSWRGINYQIRGPYDIQMEEYKPYADGCSVMGSDPRSSI